MTEKFWNNWKKRAGETRFVKLVSPVKFDSFNGWMLDDKFHKFENFEFNENTVTIKFFDTITRGHKKITVDRANVETVKFK